MNDGPIKPGLIALLGSGETSLAGGRLLEFLAQALPKPLQAAVLETPAGFELNSEQVAGRIGEYIKKRLQNYQPNVAIIPARKRHTAFSPDDPEICAPLASADLIFMGPGSPTYAVRQLKGSLAWDMVRIRHRQGAAIVFSSAAAIAIGSRVLPVYEIFKVGEDVTAPPGLDLFSDYNMEISFIPHWNNAEGGSDLDTSRCFVGMERFSEWCSLMPASCTCVGLDEHTGLIFDFSTQRCSIHGVSSISLLDDCKSRIFPAGADFDFSEIGSVSIPGTIHVGVKREAWEVVTRSKAQNEPVSPPAEVKRLAKDRDSARKQENWARADSLREQINKLGWDILDTSDGWDLQKK